MMAQWRIKEISDLIKISIRMLRHYDQMGLLTPSGRSSNGYRWYDEHDLAKLQQIIALKFFGFGLSEIKIMLQQTLDIRQSLQAQQQILKEQVNLLNQVQDAIATVLQRMQSSQFPDWNDLISLIERYRMTQDLKKTWAGKLTDEQFAQYLVLRQKYPAEFALQDKLVDQINNGELGDPEGPEGEKVVAAFSDLAKKLKEAMAELRHLNAGIFKSIKDGQLSEFPLSPEGHTWYVKATIAHWMKKWENLYQEILKNSDQDPAGKVGKRVAAQWRALLNEHFIGTSPDLAVGLMMWQEIGRQQALMQNRTVAPAPHEMVKEIYAKLYFDAAALNWIEQALNASL